MKNHIIIIMAVIVLFLAGVGSSFSRADLAPSNPISPRMLNGTVDGIDSLERLLTIQTEKKDIWLFIAVSSGDMLKGLNKGDRVVIELDEQGVAQKINKTALGSKSTLETQG